MRARGRVLAVSLLVVSAMLPLTACGPSYGNEQPMSLTVSDGEYVFHWCGEVPPTQQYLEIPYALTVPQREDHTALQAWGDFSLSPGEEFTLAAPPDGLDAKLNSTVPQIEDKILIFVYAGPSEQDISGLTVIFRLARASDLEGKWLYPSGALHDSPCEMRGAVEP